MITLAKPIRRDHLVEALSWPVAAPSGAPLSSRPSVGGGQVDAEGPAMRQPATASSGLLDRPPRILLAEDNIVNQTVAVKMLTRLGMRVDAVANGHEALKALQDLPYDLVLMDCQMPEMDGFTATGIIRAGGPGIPDPRVPIIALTAHAMQGDRDACLRAGMDDYLPKPITPEGLEAMVRHWLSVAGKWTPSPEGAESGSAPTGPGTPETLTAPGVVVTEEAFDPSFLIDNLGGDRELAVQVLGEYGDMLPGRLERIRGFLTASDLAGARREVHALRGSSATIGARVFQAAFARCEELLREGRCEEVAREITNLATAVPRFVAGIRAMRPPGPASPGVPR